MKKSLAFALVLISLVGCRNDADSNLQSGANSGSCSALESRVSVLQSQIQQSMAGKDASVDAFNSGMALVSPAGTSTTGASTTTGTQGTTASSPKPTVASATTRVKPTTVSSSNASTASSQAKPVTVTASGAAQTSQAASQGANNQVLASLQSRLAAAQAELDECNKKKFGVSALPKPTSGNAGHCDYNGQPYDILNYNCHSAANESVRDEPKITGIVSCNGLAPFQNSPAHHTFNYRVEKSTIVYYNWGQTCTAPKSSVPPNVLDPDHLRCAQAFCGDQHNIEATEAFDPGKLVEEPGPGFCSAHPSVVSLDQCNSCCQFRGTYWDKIPGNLRPTDATFANFSGQCFTSCSAKFR